jgi:hypothetical protein
MLLTLRLLTTQLAIMSATSILGRIATNLYANRLGPINLLAASTAVSGLLIVGILGATTPGGSVAFASVYGIGFGACMYLTSDYTVTVVAI